MQKLYQRIFQFSSEKKINSILLFASYPVGFPTLKVLHQHYPNLCVATHFSHHNTRTINEVETYCKENQIHVLYPVKKENTKEEKENGWENFSKEIKALPFKPELGVVCSYGYMIPGKILDLFEKGILLAHPSLIPKYRGGSPIFHAIANGEKESGASFMEVSKEKFDHGNLLFQVRHTLGEKDSYEKVEKDLSELMANNIINVIENLDKLRPGKNQDEMDTSNIPSNQLIAKIYKEKYLNISKTAEEVYNWSRALIVPRVKFNNQDIIVTFDKTFKEDIESKYTPGQLVLFHKHLYMKCSDKLIRITGWQELTKKHLPISVFISKFINKETYENNLFFK